MRDPSRRRTHLLAPLAAALLLAAAIPALAANEDQPAAPGAGPPAGAARAERFIERHDADDDGQVSREEFLRRPEAAFERLDANGDGYLDASEVPHRRPGPRGMHGRHHRRFPVDPETFVERHDADGDGLISAEEFPGPPEFFERLDENGDGLLGVDELPGRGPRGPCPDCPCAGAG